MEPEDITLQGRLVDQHLWSYCTVGDVLTDVTANTAGLSVLQRLSVAKWIPILKHDLSKDADILVSYELAGTTVIITEDRHLKAAVADVRARQQTCGHFHVHIIPPNPGSTATDPIVVPTDETPAIQVGGGEEPDGMAGNTGRCGRMIVYTEA